jgi:PRA1 family protein 1
MSRSRRFVSDSLRFTGTDLGDRSRGTSRRRFQASDGEGGGSSSEDEDDEDDYDLALLGPREKEEALVQTALMRIERARSKGRTDVNLSKDELAALERYQQRMKDEAERKERKKRKENRISVPLTHLEPVSRKKRSTPQPAGHETVSRHGSASDLAASQEQQVYPPMGYFPPPSGSRARPRSGTSASARPPSRAYEDGFQYEYVQRPSSAASRHVSDSASPRSSRGHLIPEEAWPQNAYPPPSSGNRNGLDPFLFMTAGPRAPPSAGAAAAARRHGSTPSEMSYSTRRDVEPPAAAGRRRRGARRDETSDEEDYLEETTSESTSDDLGSGAQIREPTRSRDSEIVVEVSPERDRETSSKKKSSDSSSQTKRKPVSSRGRRKKK